MKKEFLQTLQLDENHERECKLAEEGLPESIWEIYSAFANTDGGTILLGVREHRDSFTVNGLDDRQIAKYQKNFWSVLNDRNKISKNILLNHHVKVVEAEGKKLLEINVPAADRHDKPVYIGTDPMRGTYRRDYEGDFLCTEASVRAMFADQRDIPVDSEILEDMGLDAFNADTIKGYRVIFEQLHEGHPWNKLMQDEFLMKLKQQQKIKKEMYPIRLPVYLCLEMRTALRMYFPIIFWIIERNAMRKMSVGCIGPIPMKGTGAETYSIFLQSNDSNR